jgi:hypothetical protein
VPFNRFWSGKSRDTMGQAQGIPTTTQSTPEAPTPAPPTRPVKKLALRCVTCGYGAMTASEIRCAMCGGEAWDFAEWRPFSA